MSTVNTSYSPFFANSQTSRAFAPRESQNLSFSEASFGTDSVELSPEALGLSTQYQTGGGGRGNTGGGQVAGGGRGNTGGGQVAGGGRGNTGGGQVAGGGRF